MHIARTLRPWLCEVSRSPQFSAGGFFFDDYGFPTCPGARQAVDEFFADKPEVPLVLPTGQAIVIKCSWLEIFETVSRYGHLYLRLDVRSGSCVMVAKAAGVGPVSFHGPRHTHTSPLLREGLPEDMLPTRWTPPGATRYKTERQENARSQSALHDRFRGGRTLTRTANFCDGWVPEWF